MNSVARNIRWLLLVIYPIGWYLSYDLLSSELEYYLLLTLVAVLSSALILMMLRGSIVQQIHLWIIFILYLIGYYVKFYILCYMKLHFNEYNEYLYAIEMDLLNDTALIIKYYELVTIVLVSYAIIVAFLRKKRSNIALATNKPSHLLGPMHRLNVNGKSVIRLLVFTICLCIFLMYTQIQLGLGFVSGSERQMVQLPYRLAGLIMTIYNGIIPLLFLVAVWLSDTKRTVSLNRLAITLYLFFGIAAGLLSTSKASLLSVVISLGFLWLLTGTLTKKRLLLIGIMIPLIIQFNSFLTVNRILRSDLGSGIFETMITAVNYFISQVIDLPGYEDAFQRTITYLGPVMRINGADSLLNILNYNPSFSFKRIGQLLFESTSAVNDLYSTDVLGYNIDRDVAFSPSLLGYFVFVFSNTGFVCLAMVVYTLVLAFSF